MCDRMRINCCPRITLRSDLHDITDMSTFRKRLKNVLFDHNGQEIEPKHSPIEFHRHLGNVRHEVLNFLHKRLNVTGKDRVVDLVERLFGWEGHVEHGEQ